MLLFRLYLGLLILSVSGVFAEQILEGYSVVRGKDYAFEIKAPRSWVLDNEAAKDQGINLVFYPTGTRWDTSKAVIYVKVRTNGAAVRNIADQVNDTLRNLRESGSPNVGVKHLRTLTTQDADLAAASLAVTSDIEGESLLNDASALLIYRLAIGGVAASSFVTSARSANTSSAPSTAAPSTLRKPCIFVFTSSRYWRIG